MLLQNRIPSSLLLTLTFSIFVSGCDGSLNSGYEGKQRRTDIQYAIGLGNYSKVEAAASAFLSGTNECILDVRNRRITYKNSKNCAALAKLSLAYLDAGGDDTHGNEPTPIRLMGQEALKYVWMARAISELGGGMQSAWIW